MLDLMKEHICLIAREKASIARVAEATKVSVIHDLRAGREPIPVVLPISRFRPISEHFDALVGFFEWAESQGLEAQILLKEQNGRIQTLLGIAHGDE